MTPLHVWTLLCRAHCSSLREGDSWGQGARAQARQAWLLPRQPRGVRQTLRLVWRPSEPHDLEQGDQGDHGDQEEEAGITEWTEGETEVTPLSPSTRQS